MIEMLLATASNSGVSLDVLGNFISSIGFPIFVAIWLLYKSHKDTQLINDSINKLENVILELNTYIHTLNTKVSN